MRVRVRGHLVVEKTITASADAANPRYRGIDRTPPWSHEAYETGFDDPLVFGTLTDEHGLLPTVDVARSVLNKFAALHPLDVLTILFVISLTAADGGWSRPAGVDGEFLGFDVAGDAPFWSPLGDPPLNPKLREWLQVTNENGLFPSAEYARAYLAQFRAECSDEANFPIFIWCVYEVPI